MLALMGHMSRAMLERYSHIRMAPKREAVAAITLRPIVANSEGVPVKVPVAAESQSRSVFNSSRRLKILVGPVGLEPTTNGL